MPNGWRHDFSDRGGCRLVSDRALKDWTVRERLRWASSKSLFHGAGSASIRHTMTRDRVLQLLLLRAKRVYR